MTSQRLDDDTLEEYTRRDLRKTLTPDEEAILLDPINNSAWRDSLVNMILSLEYQLSSLKLQYKREYNEAKKKDELDDFLSESSSSNSKSIGQRKINLLCLRQLASQRLRYAKKLAKDFKALEQNRIQHTNDSSDSSTLYNDLMSSHNASVE